MKKSEIRKAKKVFHANKNNHIIHEMIDPQYCLKKKLVHDLKINLTKDGKTTNEERNKIEEIIDSKE